MSAFSTSPADVEARLNELGQQRLLKHLHSLPQAQKKALLDQMCGLDWASIGPLLKASQDGLANLTAEALSPIVPYVFSPGAAKERQKGEELIRQKALALFTVAGGSGSRLGYEGPKGCYGVTPVRNAPLFQVFAEKILAAQAKYGVTFPWVLMTSPQNDAQTKEFFEKHRYFGLKKEQLFFFEQGEMPAVNAQTGDLLLSAPNSLALSPDGHGGSYKGLYKSGALDWMQKQGATIISYFQVDNPLVKPVDPLFVGAHVLSGSQFSSKATPKKNAEEKVGVFGLRSGQLGIIEYSDMPQELSRAVDDKGELRFRWGNTAIHLFDIDFVKTTAANAALPYHVALKRVPYWEGADINPEKPNARKFEQFVFDAIPLAKHPMVVAIRSQEEFSPVKNASGADSPETCRADQVALWRSWLKEVGTEAPAGVFEIAPTFAEGVEDLKKQQAAGQLPVKLTEGQVLI